MERVTHIIHQWLRNNGIPSETELYGVGISSGATMLSVLSGTNRTRIVSQALYISLGNPRALRNASENYPNTLFVHLVDDDHYASKNAVAASRKILLSKHVSVVGELPLRPARLSPMTLHEREPRISAESSKRMFSVAAAYDSDIERALRESADETVSGLQAHSALRNSISQIERVMRGAHEVSSSHSNLVAEWLVEHGKKAAR